MRNKKPPFEITNTMIHQVAEIAELKELFLHPYPDYIALIVIVLCIAYVVFFVNQKTVKQKGFDYAKTLIEVCERIPISIGKDDRD